MRYYLILLSFAIFSIYLVLGYLTPSYITWTTLVIARFIFYACVDTIGEGLMVMVRKLEEEAKEFFDEVDNVSIVGTYLISRGLSRALFSCIGGYCALNVPTQTVYLCAAIAPIAMAIFTKETFFEMTFNEPLNDSSEKVPIIISGLDSFNKAINIKVLAVHFGILIFSSMLPVGDLAHRQIFLTKANESQPESILLVYVAHSLVSYGLMYYIVTSYSHANKKHLTAGGLTCILAATLPPLILSNASSSLTQSRCFLLILSTLFHLFSHLGHNLILLVYFSLLLSFVEKPFGNVSISSGIVKTALTFQPLIERSMTHWMSQSSLAATSWTMVSGVLAAYLSTEENPDRMAEEALILASYRKSADSNNFEEEERGLMADLPGTLVEGGSLETSSEDTVKHF